MHLPVFLPLSKYTGEYSNFSYKFLKKVRQENQLAIRFQHHDMVGKLESMGGNHFLCTYSNPVWGSPDIYFHAQGNIIQSVDIRIGGMVGDNDPYLFKKNK